MPIKKPTSAEPGPKDPNAPQLSEHLVKRALEINPSLRGGEKSTHEVMEDLRAQARARSKTGGAEEAPAAPPTKNEMVERRKASVSFFLEQKSNELDQALSDITARERLLADEKKALQKRVAQEIGDFLSLVASGQEAPPEIREVLSRFRALMQKLSVTEADILRASRR